LIIHGDGIIMHKSSEKEDTLQSLRGMTFSFWFDTTQLNILEYDYFF